jgi:hypothetical protein
LKKKELIMESKIRCECENKNYLKVKEKVYKIDFSCEDSIIF